MIGWKLIWCQVAISIFNIQISVLIFEYLLNCAFIHILVRILRRLSLNITRPLLIVDILLVNALSSIFFRIIQIVLRCHDLLIKIGLVVPPTAVPIAHLSWINTLHLRMLFQQPSVFHLWSVSLAAGAAWFLTATVIQIFLGV